MNLSPPTWLLCGTPKAPPFAMNILITKATRQAPPQDLITQKEAIISFIDMIGVRQIWKQGLEADDILYSLAHDNLLKALS